MEQRPPLLIRLMPRRTVSRMLGWLGRRQLPGFVLRPFLRWYVKRFGAVMEDATLPLEAYPSFVAFFTRSLEPGARVLPADPEAIASPCDGRVSASGRIEHGTLLQVKGTTYSVARLLGSEATARDLEGGTFVTIYLAPGDYHRYHWPFDGRVNTVRHIPGDLWPVNERSVHSVDGLFAINERVAVLGETKSERPFAYVPVGALNVGSMRLAFHDLQTNRCCRKAAPVAWVDVAGRRGDEFGLFEFGSTIVLLLHAEAGEIDALEPGTQLRLGDPIGRTYPTPP